MNIVLTVLLIFATANLCISLPQSCNTFCKNVGPTGKISYQCGPCNRTSGVTPSVPTTRTVPPIPSRCPPPNPRQCSNESIARQPFCDDDSECPRNISSGAMGYCCDFGCIHPHNRALTKQCRTARLDCPAIITNANECTAIAKRTYCTDDSDCNTSTGETLRCCESGCPNQNNPAQTRQCLEVQTECPTPTPNSCASSYQKQPYCDTDSECPINPSGRRMRCCDLGCSHPFITSLARQCL